MRRYVTISVLREVRDVLAREKGSRDWSEFLLELYREAKAARAREAFSELRKLLTEEELDEILKSSREFREGFRLR